MLTAAEHEMIKAARFSLLRMYAVRWDTGTYMFYVGRASSRIRAGVE